MLNRISEFLRYSLSTNNSQEVPFSEELKAIKEYYEIEKIRFEEKIDFKFNIAPLADDFPIPVFLIHPLIENAIKYGMDTCSGALQIELNATVAGHTLTIEIINNGRWVESSKGNNGTGMGLQNVQKRLQHAFPNNHKFDIIKNDGKIIGILEITRELEPD